MGRAVTFQDIFQEEQKKLQGGLQQLQEYQQQSLPLFPDVYGKHGEVKAKRDIMRLDDI
eukprot:CAMPEP_0202967890 /NCGR_PEP_ID=MMETSP1396-20130829/12927_1 /ASSEMBLY_ACC=CAM_ASM_000872 /TAXON_ID= /ORGANISM="Pseudokeronopsis sp., Strain Brazil" /LENGTH=58 /DNA_ID=CAMNT_0049693475 /DNA_START=426 /DNA_END=602 /DNA_ORIENTATION=+